MRLPPGMLASWYRLNKDLRRTHFVRTSRTDECQEEIEQTSTAIEILGIGISLDRHDKRSPCHVHIGTNWFTCETMYGDNYAEAIYRELERLAGGAK